MQVSKAVGIPNVIICFQQPHTSPVYQGGHGSDPTMNQTFGWLAYYIYVECCWAVLVTLNFIEFCILSSLKRVLCLEQNHREHLLASRSKPCADVTHTIPQSLVWHTHLNWQSELSMNWQSELHLGANDQFEVLLFLCQHLAVDVAVPKGDMTSTA